MPAPKVKDLLNPTLQAVKKLGGSASITEMDEEVAKAMSLTEEQLSQIHDERRSKFQYNMAWARTYLKAYKLLDNSGRGVWVLTQNGKEVETIPARLIKIQGKSNGKIDEIALGSYKEGSSLQETAEAVIEETWREKLAKTLLELSPDAFERLCQRLLRESGFTQVTVTGRTGDGGIDGFGLVKIGGLLSFPVLFQCKRYRGSVTPNIIRDFRGAMVGRADRGLVITTGTFTREAKKEATRDGAPPIDLLDGEQLLDKLKELRLGIEVKMIEEVSVLPEWFSTI